MIYLDNNATTPPAPEVVEAMLPFLTNRWGNPSSLYPFGNDLGQVIDDARAKVAALIGASRPVEIVFTGGGTEANHLAIRGALRAQSQKRHLITSRVEHSSILNLCKLLEAEGYTVTYLPVDCNGQTSFADLEAAITETTALVSLMWANNETGILFPMAKIAEICAKKGVLLHSDAIQAVGKLPLHLEKVGAHLVSIAAHKFHGPKGVGALVVRRGTKWITPSPGAQEHGRRAGTENVPGIVGCGVAASLAQQFLASGVTELMQRRNALEIRLLQTISDCSVTGVSVPRTGNTCNLLIDRVNGEALVTLLARDHHICLSTGSACSAGHVAASHVLTAMGVDLAHSASLRISLSRLTTPADIEALLAALPQAVAQLRSQNPPI
jgi:cysteine desulfurase